MADEQLDSIFPPTFSSEESAIERGCKGIRLRSPDDQSFYFSEMVGQEAYIAFYEYTENQAIRRYRLFLIPTWQGFHHVEAINLLNTGKEFLSVIFRGISGTGCDHQILTLLEWRSGDVHVVLLETIRIHIGGLTMYDSLDAEYSISKTEPGNPTIDFKYTYSHIEYSEADFYSESLEDEITPIREIRAHWEETLNWNPTNKTFYNFENEKEKADGSFFSVESQVSENRLRYAEAETNHLLSRDTIRSMSLPGLSSP